MTVASHSSDSASAHWPHQLPWKQDFLPYAWSFSRPIRIWLPLNIESSSWGAYRTWENFLESNCPISTDSASDSEEASHFWKDSHLGTTVWNVLRHIQTEKRIPEKPMRGRRLSISDNSHLELERSITVHLLISRISQDHFGRYPEIQSKWRYKSWGIICHLRWEISTKVVPWRSYFQSQMWQS